MISPLDAAATSSSSGTAKSKSVLNMEDFMKLLTVQLQNQNPLEPMNDRDFFAQMAQLGTVQGMDDLQKSMDVQKAQSMMGKTVTAARPQDASNVGSGDTVTGVVSRMTVKNGEYYLGIQEADGGVVDVTMDSIQNVSPSTDLTSLQSLVGKTVGGIVSVTVEGAATPTYVEGTVQRIFTENGMNFARVNVDGTQYDMRTDDIRAIAPGT